MTTVRISKSKFSFVRKFLGMVPSKKEQLRAQRIALIEKKHADPEIIWVRLVTGKEHRMSAVAKPE